MTDVVSPPGAPRIRAALVTWYYALAADGRFPKVDLKEARALLARPEAHSRGSVPAEWRDAAGQLTLVAISLVVQLGRPVYVDRCSVIALAIGAGAAALGGRVERQVDARTWGALAATLVDDADIGARYAFRGRRAVTEAREAGRLGVRGGRALPRVGPHGAEELRRLAVLLAASARRSVPMDDVVLLLGDESPEMFYQARLPHLLAGRQPYLLWDLRAATFHPLGQPLQLAADEALPASQGRRPPRDG